MTPQSQLRTLTIVSCLVLSATLWLTRSIITFLTEDLTQARSFMELTPGQYLPGLTAISPEQRFISFDPKHIQDHFIIFVVSERCPYSDQAIPTYKQLQKNPRVGNSFAWYGLNNIKALEHCKTHDIPCENYFIVADYEYRYRNLLRLVPQLLLLGPEGQVQSVISGVPSANDIDRVESYLLSSSSDTPLNPGIKWIDYLFRLMPTFSRQNIRQPSIRDCTSEHVSAFERKKHNGTEISSEPYHFLGSRYNCRGFFNLANPYHCKS